MSNLKLLRIPDLFTHIDKLLRIPAIFTFIVLFQGCFGANGVIQTPKALLNVLRGTTASPIFRFVFVGAIGYTATSDLDTAIIVTVAFFIFLHVLRTPAERKEVPYLV